MNEFLEIFMKGAPFLFKELFGIDISTLPKDQGTAETLVLIYNLYVANRISKYTVKELVVKLKAQGTEAVIESFDKIREGEF